MAQELIISPIPNLPPLKEDYAYHPKYLPGMPDYARLKAQNPKRLKQAMYEERLAVKCMNTPRALAEARETDIQSRETLIRDYAQHGKWWHRGREAIAETQSAQAPDYDLLGLNAAERYPKNQIRNAYRRKARKLHPDVGGDAEDFKRLYTAYRALLKVAV